MCFAHFLPVCSLSFHCLTSVFHRAQLINFHKVQFITFSFTHHVSGIVSKNSSPIASDGFSAMIPSGSFMALCVTFRARIASELIFVQCVQSVSRFICSY